MEILIYIAGAIFLIWLLDALIKGYRRHKRRQALIEKYGHQEGEDIFNGKVWQGMTAEQLRDSWGEPEDIDSKVMKSKSRQTWKYGQTGRNRFKERIYLENDQVVGWKEQ